MTQYTAQKKDGGTKRPWTIAKDGETSTDTDHPWSVICYRTKAEAEAAIYSHRDEDE